MFLEAFARLDVKGRAANGWVFVWVPGWCVGDVFMVLLGVVAYTFGSVASLGHRGATRTRSDLSGWLVRWLFVWVPGCCVGDVFMVQLGVVAYIFGSVASLGRRGLTFPSKRSAGRRPVTKRLVGRRSNTLARCPLT